MAESTFSKTIMNTFNAIMKGILRSPLHGMVSKSILLISFTGRKSGKTYTTPISYSTQGEYIVLVTNGNWWKNLRGGAPVGVRLRGQDRNGFAEAIAEDHTAITEGVQRHLEQIPGDAKFYGVSLDANRKPDPEQVAQAAQKLILIRIRL